MPNETPKPITSRPADDDEVIYLALHRAKVECSDFLDMFRGCTKGQNYCRCYAVARAMLVLCAEKIVDEVCDAKI